MRILCYSVNPMPIAPIAPPPTVEVMRVRIPVAPGCTIPYAIGNILRMAWGPVIAAMMA